MDASQYKDYVPVFLLSKYISDKKDRLVELEAGTTFYNFLNIVFNPTLATTKMNKNNELSDINDIANFNDNTNLGSDKENPTRNH